MRATSFFAGVALFVAGMASGWLLAHWPQNDRLPTAAAESTPGPATPVIEETRDHASSVWLTVEFDGGSTLVPAARISGSGLLLASLYSVYPANSVHYLNADGEQVFPKIVSYDHVHNLIALEDKHSSGFAVSGEDGSLYVGKRVALALPDHSLPDNTLDGQIESALQTAPNGRNYFNVAFAGTGGQRGGPLVGAESGELIGFVTNARGQQPQWMYLAGDRYSAIDASSIRTFLRTALDTPQSARDFTVRFARSAGGLRYSISRFAQREEWGAALRALEQLATLDGNNSDITQQALTLAAYYHGHQLVDGDNPSLAISLAADMRQRFPQQQPWCLVEARAYASQQRWNTSFYRVRSCLQDPYGMKPRDSELLASPTRTTLSRIDSDQAVLAQAHDAAIRFASDTNQPRSDRMNLLLGALELGEHPQIYRLLGDFEYEAQNYTVAQNYYREAIRLDPSISASLGNRLRNSAQRANSAPATEIEFEKRRGGIVVSGRLNDSSQSFRLLVDTGATYSALSRGTLLRLGLGNVLNGVSQVVELEAAGGTIYAQRFVLDSMQIGNARVTQVPVVILENLEGFDGLVGLSFLQHFDVSLDQDAGKLILNQR